MGAAIERSCDAALAVQDNFGGRIRISVETGTVTVVDDYEPLAEVRSTLWFSFYVRPCFSDYVFSSLLS